MSALLGFVMKSQCPVDNITECHLSVMSQQTTTVTNRASVIHAVIINAWYMSGLISRSVYIVIADSGPRGLRYIGAAL